ncbi:hypothetical protein LTS10_003346 [Elasticomyces elasticus]|nr:hypothetical protein LTS10_003346 [Elasticomyces elasticus]
MACAACSKDAEDSQTHQLCARCKQVSYCSKACQAGHWDAHKGSCKRPNYIIKFDLCPEAISDRLRAVIKDPVVSRTISCPATATFHRLHDALQVAFGWASTHTYDFNVLDPQFDTTQDEDDSQEALMRTIQQSMNGASASDPREYLLRVKDDTPDTGMVPRHIDKMHDSRRQHPRTREKSGPSTKLYQVLDAPEYRNERMVYTYDFGDRWEHLLTVNGRAEASTKFHCIDGSGHGVAEDVVQDGWQVLIDAYRARRPDEEQREKIHWYETRCSNGDPKGLGNGREHVWDNDAVNMRLSVMRT